MSDKKKVVLGLNNLAEWNDIDSWLDELDEFIFSELHDKESSPKSRKAAASLLLAMIEDAKRGRDWNKYKTPLGLRKWSTQINPYADNEVFSKAYGILMQYIACHIDETEISRAIQKLANVKESAVDDFIDKYRDEVATKLENASHLNDKPIERIRYR